MYPVDAWESPISGGSVILSFQRTLKEKSKTLNKLIGPNTGEEVNFSLQENLEVSGIRSYKMNHFYKEKILKLKTTSLNDILKENDAPNVIDYMSLDTEGSELEILYNFDFIKYHINYICIEDSEDFLYRKKIYDFLLTKNFVLNRYNFWDSEYINSNFKG